MCKSVGTGARICHVHHAAGNATQFVRLWITLRWLTVAVQLVVWEMQNVCVCVFCHMLGASMGIKPFLS